MDLLALSDFTLVARHGGFGRAARASARPKATLSRRVGELEAGLGIRLFERGARALKLTQEGRTLYERAGLLLNELEEATAAIASGGEKPRGRLRISAPLVFSQTAMGKIAAGFVQAYPDVRLEVTTEDRAVDLIEEGFDLVIRVDPPSDLSLVGRAFLRDRLVVVASPDLKRPTAGHPAPAASRHASDTMVWRLSTPEGPSELQARPVLTLSSLIMVRDAVRAGAGAGCLPISLVSTDLAAGRLVHWGDVADSAITLWALYPSRRLLSARVSAFLDYLKQAFPNGTPDELAAFMEG